MSGRGPARRPDVEPGKICLQQLLPDHVTPEYVSWLNDPKVNAWLEARHLCPHTLESTRRFVQRCLDEQRYHWGVLYDGVHVGNVTCSEVNLIYRYATVSNVVGDLRFQRTPLAKFALSGALDYLLLRRGFHRVEAVTYANHLSGVALLANLGFVKEGAFRERVMFGGRYVDFLLFGLLQAEWKTRRINLPVIEVVPPAWDL